MNDRKSDHDVIILGAGPAGATAGIYLARFLFRTLLLETSGPARPEPILELTRSETPGRFMNVPGFPQGVERYEFKQRVKQQAVQAGCTLREEELRAISKENGLFTVHGSLSSHTAEVLVLAMGIQDDWSKVPGLERLIGHASLYWSVASNGKEAVGKSAAVLGNDDYSVQEVFRLREFTPKCHLFTNGKPLQCSAMDDVNLLLSRFNIPVFEQRIKTVVCTDYGIEKLILEDNRSVDIQILFSPSKYQLPRSGPAREIGVETDVRGYILVNERFETNIPNIYAVGDITMKPHKQVVTSLYHGLEAAWAIYDRRFQNGMRLAMQEALTLAVKLG